MENKAEAQVDTEVQTPSPYDFLKDFKGAPTQQKINEMKSQAPGGRIKLVTSSDGKRVYLLRAVSAFELQKLQDTIMSRGMTDAKYPTVLKAELAAKCIVWTNATPTGTMSVIDLNQSGAGLVDTLHEVISELSDYMESPQIARFSADL